MQTVLSAKVSSQPVFGFCQIRQATTRGRVRNAKRDRKNEELRKGIKRQQRLLEHKERMTTQSKEAVERKLERELKHKQLVAQRIAAKLGNQDGNVARQQVEITNE